jgi:hypothetical protein
MSNAAQEQAVVTLVDHMAVRARSGSGHEVLVDSAPTLGARRRDRAGRAGADGAGAAPGWT